MVPSGRRKKLGLEPVLALIEAAGEFTVTKSANGPLGPSVEVLLLLLVLVTVVAVRVRVVAVPEEVDVAVPGSLVEVAVSESLLLNSVAVPGITLSGSYVWRTWPCLGLEIITVLEIILEDE